LSDLFLFKRDGPLPGGAEAKTFARPDPEVPVKKKRRYLTYNTS
jgi:hypothetical protein